VKSLLIQTPSAVRSEIEWVCSSVLGEFLGIEMEVVPGSGNDVVFRMDGDKRSLVFPIPSMLKAADRWLGKDSLPELAEIEMDLFDLPEAFSGNEKFLPVIGNRECPVIEGSGDTLRVGADLLGTIFFLQSRYEECVGAQRDAHGRFPVKACLHAKWLDRPVADECKWVVAGLVESCWPGLIRPNREFRIRPSHDIDYPSFFPAGAALERLRVAAHCALDGDVARSFSAFAGRPVFSSDPYDRIDWLAKASEKRGLRSIFYYIPEQTDPQYDPPVNLDSELLRRQWRRIRDGGHEIGIHPGYAAIENEDGVKRGLERLQSALGKAGLDARVVETRQHFLRWQTPQTARQLQKAGLECDSSLAFAEMPGFRCGTCRSFRLYDPVRRQALDLRERPLILMDRSLTEKDYAGCGTGEEALLLAARLKQRCRDFGGDFTILWHNTQALKRSKRKLYEAILDA